jgi:hypothetical protein
LHGMNLVDVVRRSADSFPGLSTAVLVDIAVCGGVQRSRPGEQALEILAVRGTAVDPLFAVVLVGMSFACTVDPGVKLALEASQAEDA